MDYLNIQADKAWSNYYLILTGLIFCSSADYLSHILPVRNEIGVKTAELLFLS